MVLHFLFLSLDISGIPSLVVVKKDGTLVTKDGDEDIGDKTPEEVVKKWMS